MNPIRDEEPFAHVPNTPDGYGALISKVVNLCVLNCGIVFTTGLINMLLWDLQLAHNSEINGAKEEMKNNG